MALTEDQAKAAYDSIQAKVASTARSIAHFENLIKVSKNAKDRAKAQVMLIKLKKQMGGYKETAAKAQNVLWETRGEYEKLLKGTERDAFMAINALFQNYDLGELAGKIFDYVKNGYSPDTISILLQDTKEYKERFAGNEERKKAGLPVLSPGEYLSTEASYRQIMQTAGLPPGFYDSKDDFSKFIGMNMSPSEIQQRVDLATQATILAPTGYREALKQMGIGEGEMVAYWLNEKKALPYIQKAAATAAVGAAAINQGLTFDTDYAASLATTGVSADQARQGYAQIASELPTLSNLGSIYGEEWDQRSSEESVFEGKQMDKRRKLASQERGSFSGGAGAARGGLGQRGGQR